MPSFKYMNQRVKSVNSKVKSYPVKNIYNNVNVVQDIKFDDRVDSDNYCDPNNFKTITNCSGKRINKYCMGTFRKPLPGYRKELDIDTLLAAKKGDCLVNMQEIYKDNHSKSVSLNSCYDKRIRSINNKNGKKDLKYCSSYSEYLRRKCKTYKQNNNIYKNNDGTYRASSCPDGVCNVTYYEEKNPKYSKNSSVSSSTRLVRLKYDAISANCVTGDKDKKCGVYNSFIRNNLNKDDCKKINSVGCAGTKTVNKNTSYERKTSWKSKRMRIGGVMRKAR